MRSHGVLRMPRQIVINGNAVTMKSLLEFVWKFSTVTLLPLVIWLLVTFLTVKEDVAILKDNRFTVQAGIELERRLTDVLTEQVGRINDRIDAYHSDGGG